MTAESFISPHRNASRPPEPLPLCVRRVTHRACPSGHVRRRGAAHLTAMGSGAHLRRAAAGRASAASPGGREAHPDPRSALHHLARGRPLLDDPARTVELRRQIEPLERADGGSRREPGERWDGHVRPPSTAAARAASSTGGGPSGSSSGGVAAATGARSATGPVAGTPMSLIASSTISRNAGAATSPPCTSPLGSSRNTPTTTRGASAGAKPTNELKWRSDE